MFSEFMPEPEAITAGDDHVMVWVKIRMTGHSSGKTIDTDMIEVFKFEGDKLIEIWPFYYDSDKVNSIV